MRFDVARGRVADCDRRIRAFGLLTQYCRHRFADDVAASQNHNLRAFNFHLRTNQYFTNAGRRAGLKTRRIAKH